MPLSNDIIFIVRLLIIFCVELCGITLDDGQTIARLLGSEWWESLSVGEVLKEILHGQEKMYGYVNQSAQTFSA